MEQNTRRSLQCSGRYPQVKMREITGITSVAKHEEMMLEKLSQRMELVNMCFSVEMTEKPEMSSCAFLFSLRAKIGKATKEWLNGMVKMVRTSMQQAILQMNLRDRAVGG